MPTLAPSAALVTLYVGRQPIFDRALDTFGYELLFRRSAGAASAEVVDGGTATARVVVNAVTEIGLDHLVGRKRAFINLTEQFILEPELLAEVLPTDRVVLEILEHVAPTPAIVAGVARLRAMGYCIALDDFEYDPEYDPLLDLAHVVKYDYAQTNGPRLVQRIAADHRAGRRVVVERIEDHRQHRDAERAGADYYQGYFFAKPATITTQAVPPGRLTLVQLLARVNDPDASIDEIVSVLAQDVAMSVKTLRFVNSAGSGVSRSVDSIERAAILLGRDRLRSWTSLTLMAAMHDQTPELIALALVRAKACETIARAHGRPNPSSYYAAGMLSLLDVITGTTMETVLRDIPLSAEIADCLLGRDNDLSAVLGQVVALERGGASFATADADALRAHQDALVWATSLVSNVATT